MEDLPRRPVRTSRCEARIQAESVVLSLPPSLVSSFPSSSQIERRRITCTRRRGRREKEKEVKERSTSTILSCRPREEGAATPNRAWRFPLHLFLSCYPPPSVLSTPLYPSHPRYDLTPDDDEMMPAISLSSRRLRRWTKRKGNRRDAGS